MAGVGLAAAISDLRTDLPKSAGPRLHLNGGADGFVPAPGVSTAGAEGGLNIPLRRLLREHNILTEGDGTYPRCLALDHSHNYSWKRNIALADHHNKITVLRCPNWAYPTPCVLCRVFRLVITIVEHQTGVTSLPM